MDIIINSSGSSNTVVVTPPSEPNSCSASQEITHRVM
jgi:hypothetical protein